MGVNNMDENNESIHEFINNCDNVKCINYENKGYLNNLCQECYSEMLLQEYLDEQDRIPNYWKSCNKTKCPTKKDFDIRECEKCYYNDKKGE